MPGKLGLCSKNFRDMSLLRTIAVKALVVSLTAMAMTSLAACGKKGPLYLPDPAASAAPAGAVPADREKQERR